MRKACDDGEFGLRRERQAVVIQRAAVIRQAAKIRQVMGPVHGARASVGAPVIFKGKEKEIVIGTKGSCI